MSEILDKARRKLHAEKDITNALNKLESMEKQFEIGYKPGYMETKPKLDGTDTLMCGNCGLDMGKYYDKKYIHFCKWCGAMVDWSDEE